MGPFDPLKLCEYWKWPQNDVPRDPHGKHGYHGQEGRHLRDSKLKLEKESIFQARRENADPSIKADLHDRQDFFSECVTHFVHYFRNR